MESVYLIELLQVSTIALVGWVLRQVHLMNGSVRELHEWKRGHETLHKYLEKEK